MAPLLVRLRTFGTAVAQTMGMVCKFNSPSGEPAPTPFVVKVRFVASMDKLPMMLNVSLMTRLFVACNLKFWTCDGAVGESWLLTSNTRYSFVTLLAST